MSSCWWGVYTAQYCRARVSDDRRALGPYLAYMPDGEVGDRRYWIDGIAYRVLNGHPEIDTKVYLGAIHHMHGAAGLRGQLNSAETPAALRPRRTLRFWPGAGTAGAAIDGSRRGSTSHYLHAILQDHLRAAELLREITGRDGS